jgi:hypothetical protein
MKSESTSTPKTPTYGPNSLGSCKIIRLHPPGISSGNRTLSLPDLLVEMKFADEYILSLVERHLDQDPGLG